jgi:hypothetical protein
MEVSLPFHWLKFKSSSRLRQLEVVKHQIFRIELIEDHPDSWRFRQAKLISAMTVVSTSEILLIINTVTNWFEELKERVPEHVQ